jgi:hypothetical protein
MPDCWLEVSLHPEDRATGQLDQVVPWFSSLLERNAELVLKFHVALHASHAALPMVTSTFHYNATLPTWQKLHSLSNISLPEGRAGTAWEPSKPGKNMFFSPL